VAAASYSTSVAVVSFDAAGNPSGVAASGNAFDMLAGGPITAIAAVTDTRQCCSGRPLRSSGTCC
jgi:hypothetical protein